ncbi:ATP-binding cassette domain-containing protein [Cohnella rhizosphaerae]|uniref:ATP-binding cassette domain-containing protein n=1 Tax=Cohnella rhizosphaerae TaxID=1457232 RepID=UPI0030B8D8D9
MIHIIGLTRKLPTGKKVLDGIHGHLEPGKLYAVVGASGSGKSMLLRCLGLKEPWTSGGAAHRRQGRDRRRRAGQASLKAQNRIPRTEGADVREKDGA